MIDLAVAEGLDRKELVDAAGLGGIDLTAGDARVPIATQVALWQLIAKRLPSSNFGLRAGTSFKVREAGLLGYVVAHSATLETALERLVRYSWVLNDAVKCEMVKNQHSLAVTQSYPEHGVGLQDAVDYRPGIRTNIAASFFVRFDSAHRSRGWCFPRTICSCKFDTPTRPSRNTCVSMLNACFGR